MEFVYFLIIVVVIIIFFTKIINKLEDISGRVQSLRKEIDTLKSSTPAKPPTVVFKEEAIAPKPQVIKQPPVEVKKVREEEEFISTPKQKEPEPVFNLDLVKPLEPKKEKSFTPPPPPAPGFWEKNPDLEKFIGENLINKIGIAILVLGIGFFVKFAIDKEWINEFGRVGIGFIAGGILVGVAHRMRKTFTAFSSVLIGGGMAVMYFTISIAFHDYHIFSQTMAFILMVIVTGFTIFLAAIYNRVELAVLAIIGGFSAPFLVSTGEGNYVVLFTYLLILNVGMLVLAYLKKWNLVNIVSYVFTIILYGGWLTTKVIGVENAPYAGALLFATIFYLVFFLMNIINNVKENRKFNAVEISMILSNTFLYFSSGMVILANIDKGIYQGLFTALLAVFNFVFVLFLFKKTEVDKNLIYLLLGLVLTFVSLAAPIQLEGNYITLFWALESVLLMWLAQKSGIMLMKMSSVLIIVLMVGSLAMDWVNIYINSKEVLTLILNKGFVTSVVCLTSLAGNIFLLSKDSSLTIFKGLDRQNYKSILSCLLGVLLYVSLLLEINYQAHAYLTNSYIISLVIGWYNYLFIIGVCVFALKAKNQTFTSVALLLGVAGLFAYLAYYQFQITYLRNDYLQLKTSLPSFLVHYLIVFSVIIMAFLINSAYDVVFGKELKSPRIYTWVLSALLVFIASAELINIILMLTDVNFMQLDERLSQIRKIGFPILWGGCSFIFMYLGMKRKNKDLRIISLSLFFITLVKLFVFDLREISEGGKIAAFIILGILLLIISFMYQKLKTIILDESPKDEVKP